MAQVSYIDEAVRSLCEKLDVIFVNFFDPTTTKDLERPASRRTYMVATGTYACGEWRRGEDVILVCMTQNSEILFWQFVVENLQLKEQSDRLSRQTFKGVMELSDTALSNRTDGERSLLADFVRLSKNDAARSKFYLHYAKIPPGWEPRTWRSDSLDTRPHLVPEYPRGKYRGQNPGVERNLKMIRDTQQMAHDFRWQRAPLVSAGTQAFITSYRNLRCWAKAHGLLGAQLGFLDSPSLMWIIHGAYVEDWSPKAGEIGNGRGTTLLQASFKRFDHLIQDQCTWDEFLNVSLEIMTPSKHVVSSNLTPEATQAIYKAIQTTFVQGTQEIKEEDRFGEFLDDFAYFFKVDCECWDPSAGKRAEFEEYVVPENLNKLVKHLRDNRDDRDYGAVYARIWPVPFLEKAGESKHVYAIGLRRSAASRYDSEKILGDLASYIERRVLDYEPTVGIINVSLATREEFEPLLRTVDGDEGTVGTSSTLTAAVESTKFRTGSQAMNRLRHDPAHAGVEYDVGYEDRFAGMMWMTLEEWGKKATEEEDFIPGHRVRQIKRREDGRVVWDRQKRVDMTSL